MSGELLAGCEKNLNKWEQIAQDARDQLIELEKAEAAAAVTELTEPEEE